MSKKDVQTGILWVLGVVAGGFALYYGLLYGLLGFFKTNKWFWGHFLGEGVIDLLIGLLGGVFFSALVAFVVWAFVALALRLLKRHTNEVLVKSWWITFASVGMLVMIPHYQMSRKLLPLKIEFRKAAASGGTAEFTGDYADGRPINTLNFGGSLDRVIEERDRYLARHQYLPGLWLNGRWWATDGWSPDFMMGYIYTYLPKSVYDQIAIRVFWEGNAKAYYAWLNPPVPPAVVVPRYQKSSPRLDQK